MVLSLVHDCSVGILGQLGWILVVARWSGGMVILDSIVLLITESISLGSSMCKRVVFNRREQPWTTVLHRTITASRDSS